MANIPVYFIWGEEAFLIDQEIEKIIAGVREQSGEDPEVTFIDGDELKPYELLEKLDFTPLFFFRRVLVIKRPHWLGKAKGRFSKGDEILKIIENYLKNPPQGQILILTAEEYKKTNPIAMQVAKAAQIISCAKPDSKYLAKWVKKEFKSRGITISAPALNRIAKSGQNMYYLTNLIDKLSLQVKDNTVSEIDIAEEFSNKEDINIFKLTDALLARDAKQSLKAYYQLQEQGSAPPLILYMIVRQFITMARVKYYYEEGDNISDIARLTGTAGFVAKKMLQGSRKYNWKEIELLFKRFLQADIELKTTSHDKQVVIEALIIQVCSI